MKRLLPVLVCCLARAAAAQTALAGPGSEPAVYEPKNVEVRGDGRCMTVRPGDTVHYALTIEGVGGAPSVYGDLRLRQRLGRGRELLHEEPMRGGLPVRDFRSLGGGGLGVRDASDGKMYHFSFKVPKEIFGGSYRGVEVSVNADQPPPAYQTVSLHVPKIVVTHRTRDEVHAYCLNVMSSFGVVGVSQRAVTNFAPGPIDPAGPVLTPPSPQPLPQPRPFPPPPPGPPPQPR